jgi:hypothetical protein
MSTVNCRVVAAYLRRRTALNSTQTTARPSITGLPARGTRPTNLMRWRPERR